MMFLYIIRISYIVKEGFSGLFCASSLDLTELIFLLKAKCINICTFSHAGKLNLYLWCIVCIF